jgi:hypothetical protein
LGLFAREYEGPPLDLLPRDPANQARLDARAARRTLRFFAVAVFVLVVGAAFAYTVTRERNGGSTRSPGRTGTTSAASAAAAVDSIGPAANAEVGPYLDERKQALVAATGERAATVSFDAYLSEADARAKVGAAQISPAQVKALLAAAPGAHPATVTDGLEAWAKTQRQADTVDRDEIRKLLPTVDDPVFKKFYESELVRLDAAIDSASPTSEVVFGMVVVAPAEALRALAATAGVRLVDVGGGATTAPGAAFRGLRPEETTKVGQPATRPV